MENSNSLILLAHRICQLANERVHHDETGHKLTARQIQVLLAIKASEGSSQIELAEATGIDRSTMADLIRRLVKYGFVQRTRTKSDARAYSVSLTADGHCAANSGNTILAQAERQLLERLPYNKQAELTGLLQQVVTTVSVEN